ncbi:GATA transcription factor nreB-Penicillium chrysogenum [Penicillium mononematosum]|uniref:GATA transcription factor nreB-Penicillium chrysogenum n=1 Tax=Penicillium mononematosum TaxID=268346 RepID=UPI002547FA43|nr:GATA transcription factor nreB-Penicillium chrysogenum [Penicillium mononematosum]KAJ6188277.1 GATA transcription factor nreB-Penicillium chrysogenum [Penicillium mononematosum]
MATTLTDDKRPQLQPVCQNCGTSTTPPVALKTDVIKSRNRVKTGQGPKRKSGGPVDTNGIPPRSEAGTPPLGSHGYRRASRKMSSGHSDRSNSPVSRTETPGFGSMNAHNSNIAPQHMFDSVTLGDSLNSSSGLPSRQMRQPSPSAVDRQLDSPTHSKVSWPSTHPSRHADASARRSEMIVRDSEVRLRRSLEDAQRREEDLKRRVSDLERQLGSGSAGDAESGEPLAKKIRLSDVVESGEDVQVKSPKSV